MYFLWPGSILFGSFLLSGCQTGSMEAIHKREGQKKVMPAKGVNHKKSYSTAQDGAPPGPIPTKFKSVTPVQAPLSRYGNPGVYRVNGRTYKVMTRSSGYRTRGMASWYGTRFHSKRTSSGEEYDMYALTAAHKTLPIPCYVRVKNLDNGRVAIVRVNDRGPFHSDRIIDLSYAAGVKLGVFPKGTAHVEIEALNVNGAHQAHFYLQAGAFTSEQLERLMQQKLAKLSPSPVFIEKNSQHYLVRVGPFANRRMAENLKGMLARNGVKGSFSYLI
jgi:rare lipoprotein A